MDHFPNKKIHITNELIHNPEVNEKLEALNVQFIEKVPGSSSGEKDFSMIQDGDVVILPAFGASFEEMALFDKKVRLLLYILLDSHSSSSAVWNIAHFWLLHLCSIYRMSRLWIQHVLGFPKFGMPSTSIKSKD